MIDYLNGKLKEIDIINNNIIIEISGVGYKINLSKYSINFLQEKIEENICIYIVESTSIFNGNSNMYGFINKEERELFQIIKTVNKIGAKGAIDILGRIGENVGDFIKNISENNSKGLHDLFGFTMEKADKLILGLKNKIKNLATFSNEENSNINSQNFSNDAIEALKILGYNAVKSKKIVLDIIRENPNYKLEEIIKKALKIFKEK